MTSKHFSLTPSPIWNLMANGKSFESFKTHILPEIFLKKQVPEEVVHNVEVIRKLLSHSYFEYDFIDIALTHSIFILEQALKIRYHELNSKPYKGSFKNLIDWFFKRGYFETYNSGIVHQLRYIRNGKVHDEKNTIGGIAFLAKVKTPIILINDILEDAELRKERKKKIEDLQIKLNDWYKDGAILKFLDSQYIIDRVSVVFINNKVDIHILSIIAWPIYDPKVYLNEEKNYSTRPSIELRCNVWGFEKNEFFAINENNEKVTLSPIVKSENQVKYKAWLKECDNAKDMAMFNDLGASRIVNNSFLKELDLFHKQE